LDLPFVNGQWTYSDRKDNRLKLRVKKESKFTLTGRTTDLTRRRREWIFPYVNGQRIFPERKKVDLT
jgi:hypothetical protein